MADPNNPNPTDLPTLEELEAKKDIAQEYSNAILKIGEVASDSAKYINLLAIAATGASTAFTNFGNKTLELTSFSKQLEGLEKLGRLTTDTLKSVASSMGMENALGASTAKVHDFVVEMAKAADDNVRFQQGFLGMAGATGGLGKIFQDAGANLEDLNEVMRKQQALLQDTAVTTHSTVEQVAQFATIMGTSLPASVTDGITVTDASGRSLTALEATMSLAAGTGRTVESVVKNMTTAYENFNIQGNDALEWTAQITDLSTKFNIPISYTEGFLTRNAEAFSRLSDKANDTGNTFNRMFQSFRETGLSAKQSADVIGEITGSLSHLTVAQKAFMSAQTGGPGGLQGAFRVDNLIRQGKVDEVLKMAEDNLRKQFGGKIYTQEEAGQSQFAASQFYRQQQLVRSGAFGGLVKDDATATRLLEAMAKGTGTKEALKEPDTVLRDSIGKGQGIQETTNTILLELLHTVQQGKSLGGYTALETIQQYGGSAPRTGRTPDAQYRANLLEEQTNAARNRINIDQQAIRGGRLSPQESIGNLSGSNLRNAGGIISSILPQQIREKLTGIMDQISSGNKEEGEANYQKMVQDLQSRQDSLRKRIATGATAKDNTLFQENQKLLSQIEDVHANYEKLMNNRPANRSVQSATAVNNALANRNVNAAVPGPTAAPRPGNTQAGNKVEVTIHGVICERCAKPIKPSEHTTVVTGNTY